MAKGKVNTNENILVKVDQNNLIYIDPNSVVDKDGVISPRELKQENLVMYVNLEADIIPRSILVSENERNTLTSIAKGTLNFLKNQNGRDYDTSWTESYLTSTEKTQTDESGRTVGTGEYFQSDSSGQSFGIESISISIKGYNAIPEIQITFQDIRGKTLFESPDNSPYQAFFHLPWPIFYLTVKGFYGKAIRYRLHLVKMSSKFIDSTGNFQVVTAFVGSTYAYLSDIPLKGILNAPYMFMVENTTDTTTNTDTGNTIRKISRSSRGYATLRTVYAEYRQKGLLPKDFPVKTLREIITIAQNLDRILEKEISNQIVDARLFVAIKSFDDSLKLFLDQVKAWAKLHLTQTFNVANSSTPGIKDVRYYIQAGPDKTNTKFIFSILENKEGTLEFLIEQNKTRLKDNELFTSNIINQMAGDFSKEKIFVKGIGDIDGYIRVLSNNQVEVAIDKLIEDINEIKKNFETQKSSLNNAVELKMNEIIKNKSLGGFGFDPTIRNIFGVILANAEVYIRLLRDVHRNAFEQSTTRKRLLKNLSQETKGDDAIYPWPEVKKNSGGDKDKVLAYPGDPDLISVLQSNDETLWPEVSFVENFIDVSTNRLDSNTEKESGVDKIEYSFEDDLDIKAITHIDTGMYVADSVSYINKTPSSFLYELYERGNYFTLYESFNEATLRELSQIEYKNINEVVKGEDEIREILDKKVSVISTSGNNFETNLTELMRSFSPFERYPYYEDNLPTTQYLKDITEVPFRVEEFDANIPTAQYAVEFPALNDNLKNYYPETYRKNIYPFNSTLYLNYLNTDEFKDEELKIKGNLSVNLRDGFITSPVAQVSYVKPDYRTNLFDNKIKIGTGTTTNILNTPYFHNQLYSDFVSVSSYGKYAGSAYLLLNSLPFYDLEDKIQFPNISEPIRMSSLFREVGASHFIPYHLAVKWGSIYHRYKKYILEEVDIIDGTINTSGVTKNIDGAKFFNNNEGGSVYSSYTVNGITVRYKYSLSPTPTPTVSNTPTPTLTVSPTITPQPSASANLTPTPTPSVTSTKTPTPTISPTLSLSPQVTPSVTPSISTTATPTPTLTINASSTPTPSITPSITPTITPTISPIYFDDAGMHPYYDAVYHQVVNNYTHYIVESGDTSFSSNVALGAINARYRTQPNNIKYWTSYVDNSKFDPKDKRYTLLPCDGANKFINFKVGKIFSTNLNIPTYVADSFDRTVQNNFRCVWQDEFINDEYSGKTFPSYSEYHRTYVSGETKTNDNIYAMSNNYRKIVDLMGTFSPQILDYFEEMFLDFASEKVFSGDTFNRYRNIKYTKFQDLLKEISSVEKQDGDGTDIEQIIEKIITRQGEKFKLVTNNILSSTGLIKLTIANAKELNPYVLRGFIKSVYPSENNTFYHAAYDASQATTENLNYLKLYLGEDFDGYYHEFFVANDVELSEDNILSFRQIILMYAGYRKSGQSPDPTTFKTYIRDNIFVKPVAEKVLGSDARRGFYLNALCPQLKFKIETNVNNLKLTSGYNNADLKLEIYNMFKSFNDKWIAGNSIGQRLLLEEFLFLDKANRDIGDKAYLNISKLMYLDDAKNAKLNLYSTLGSIIGKESGFDMRAMPAYVNFNGTNTSNKSKIVPSKKVAENLFGTFLDVDYQESSPKILLQLVGQTSKHPADMNKNYKFADDTFNVGNTNRNPLMVTLPQNLEPDELYKSNRVIAFEVSFGDQNQNIFKSVQLDQNSIKNTSESFIVLENLGRSETGSGAYNVDTSLFEYYRQASYTCDITCMGNVMIQPTMYFYLKNIPMFRGTYWITEVSHNIQNNQITTTFKGTRIPYSSLPDPKDSFTSSYRPFFEKILRSLQTKVKETDKSQTNTTISIKGKNGVSVETEILNKQDFEDIPKNLVATVGYNDYGVPYNGQFDERYIQLVKYDNQEWLRGIVVEMNGPKNPIEDDYRFGVVSELANTQALTWKELNASNENNNFFTTHYRIDRTKGITPEKIITATTTFLNPKTKLSTEVTYSAEGTAPNRTFTGPVGIGPFVVKTRNAKTNEIEAYEPYSVGLSKKLMQTLKLVDGDIVYFKMV